LSYSFVPGRQKAALKDALKEAKFFQDKKHLSRVARGGRDAIQNVPRSTFHIFKNEKKMVKATLKQHDKGSV
jgi:collagen type VI alpha